MASERACDSPGVGGTFTLIIGPPRRNPCNPYHLRLGPFPVSFLRVSVPSSDEAQCLGKLLGERRKLGSALGQVLNGPQLLGRRGRNGLGLLTGGLRAGARLPQGLGDSRRQLGAVASHLRHLLPGARRLRGRLGDALEG